MKVSKIPGLGQFGVFIDDVDLNTITDEEWMEIGKIHLESLVTIIRAPKIDHHRYAELMTQWGPWRYNSPIQYFLKYGKPLKDVILAGELDVADQITLSNGRRWQVDKRYPGMVRITPRKNRRGESMGLFGDGELLWHSNEAGDLAFTPCVALMGVESMIGSCTGFVTTTDWYEAQSESFRSELDEMVVVHNYKPAMVNPVVVKDQEDFYKSFSCPHPDMEVPLIIKSPGGIKGIHLGVHVIDKIKGMSKEASDKIFKIIKDGIFVDQYIYKHWYKSNNDICIFDNSITLHNREIDGENLPERLGYRIQFDQDYVTGGDYTPYYQKEYNDQRIGRLRLLREAMAGMEYSYDKQLG